MDDKQYIEQRLDDQKDWYSKNSQKNQRWHKLLQIILFFSAASIPFLNSVITNPDCLKYATGVLGLLIAVITGITALYKFDEKWIKYRTTAEALKHEKFLYETRVEPYEGAKPFPVLVQRVESLISQENRDWAQYINKTNDKKTT